MKKENLVISIFSKQIQTVFLGLFLTITTIVYSHYSMNENELVLLSCLYLSLLFIVTCTFDLKFNIQLKINDLIILIYLLYNIVLLILSSHFIDPIRYFECSGIILLYILSRNVTKAEIILVFIIISAIIQALYGIGQQCGFFISNHSYFSITGSFNNPGPFGGYLSIGFVLSFLLIFSWKRKWIQYSAGISSIIIGIGLVLSDSRAAWLSAIILSLIFFIVRISPKRHYLPYYILGLIVIIGLFSGLVHYKKESAKARLMIWEITLLSVGEHCLTGKGISAFPAQYMYQQAAYFKKHPDSDRTCLAANNTYAFNECLRVLYEQGIIGLVLLGGVLINAFAMRTNDNSTIFFMKQGLFALLVFSFFSYPADVLPLKYLFPLFIGFLPGKDFKWLSLKKDFQKLIRFISLFLSLTVLLSGVAAICLNSKIAGLIENYYYESDEIADKALKRLYPYFENNKELTLKYARALFTERAFIDAIPVLEKATEMSPSSLLLCDLGTAYSHTNQLHKAENTFINASYMTPRYILPYYHLFLLYGKQNKIENQIKVANKIDQMTVKTKNRITQEIKLEIKHFLKSIN